MANPGYSLPWLSPSAFEADAWAAPKPAPPDAKAWRAAEAANVRELATAVAAFAQLQGKLRRNPLREALTMRLALTEAAAMAAAEGATLSAERIALDQVNRLGGVEREAQDLARLHWAARRMTSPRPIAFETIEALDAFLDRQGDAEADDWLLTTPAFDGAALRAWRRHCDAFTGLHPLTKAAAAHHAWRLLGVGDLVASIEPTTLAACIGAGGERAEAPFVPILSGDRHGLNRLSGLDPKARLAAWLKRVAAASAHALAQIERLEDWRAAVLAQAPPREAALADPLLRFPALSAPMAAKALGVSALTIRRRLAALEALGLVTEMTGQERFRYWRAAA